MPSIEEQLRYFSVKVNSGSGCVFQPDTIDYTYILTVKHNIEKEDKSIYFPNEIVVRRYNLESDPLHVISVYQHDSLDIAIVLVEYIGDLNFPLAYAIPQRGESVLLFGYPDYLKNEPVKTTNLRCECDFEHQKNISFEIISNNPLFTFNRGAQQNVIGFSGSGIFFVEGKNLILKGIFPNLNDPEGAHNKINGFYVDCFNEITANNKLPELIPSSLTSFKNHGDHAFSSLNRVLRDALFPHLNNILNSTITPMVIIQQFGGSLYTPYSENYKNKLINPLVWKAWIELLTFLDISIETPDYILTKFLRNTKLFYSENINIIDEFIEKFLCDQILINSICANDLIVYSSEGNSALKFCDKEKIQKIVANIYPFRNTNSSIFIDDPNCIKPFSCIHLEHFAEKIAEIDSDLPTNEVKRLIKNEIQNILDYGNN